MAPPICTLVHVSDPHFGSSFVIDGESEWREFVARAPFLRHVTGLFPHGYQAAGALAVAVRQILKDRRDRGIDALVVHTGDLTASGSQAEFSVGNTFLRHGHYLENGSLAGLALATDFGQLAFDIPGNHDLWHRRSPKDHAAFTSHYGGAYPRFRAVANPRGRVLLYGLDSNRSSTWQHRLANGEVAPEQIRLVCESLGKERNTGAIQVVCLHHPLWIRRRTTPRMLGVEVLRLRDRHSIARELAAAGAHLVLAGHVHAQQHSRRAFGRPNQFVAGSACQISSRPTFWVLDLHADTIAFDYIYLPRRGIHFQRSVARSGRVPY